MDTETRLRALVAAHLCLDAEDITAESAFAEDLNADSLDSVELTMAVEEEFGIEIGDDEADAAFGPDGTFAKALALVEAKLGEKVDG